MTPEERRKKRIARVRRQISQIEQKQEEPKATKEKRKLIRAELREVKRERKQTRRHKVKLETPEDRIEALAYIEASVRPGRGLSAVNFTIQTHSVSRTGRKITRNFSRESFESFLSDEKYDDVWSAIENAGEILQDIEVGTAIFRSSGKEFLGWEQSDIYEPEGPEGEEEI